MTSEDYDKMIEEGTDADNNVTVDGEIGKIGDVTKKISPNKYGEVKVFDSVWTAKSDKEIKVGEKVKVLSIEGVKLIVEREDDII